MSIQTIKVLGLMSGSSLDGIDLTICNFDFDPDSQDVISKWEISAFDSLSYSEEWKERLKNGVYLDGKALCHLNADYAQLLAEKINQFLTERKLSVDLVASHGHTIAHHPEKNFTIQIGDGATLSTLTQLPVVSDFRNADIAAGGHGAPLAPIVDEILFPQYDHFLNLGGISNISYKHKQGRIGFDIGPANQILNPFAEALGLPYDDKGNLAKQGKLHEGLLTKLLELDFLQQGYPKSLDNAWIKLEVLPIFQTYDLSPKDSLHTACHFIAQTIEDAFKLISSQSQTNIQAAQMLISGGGAFNDYLLSLISASCASYGIECVKADPTVIEFKESLLMALMGLLRIRGLNNTIKSVTGAQHAVSSGAIFDSFGKLKNYG